MRAPGRRVVVLAALGSLLGVAMPAPASPPPMLRFDPFRAPPEAPVAAAPGRGSDADRSFRPVLISTVVGGRRSTANLGGEILAIGESSRGYRLLEVRPFEAVFEKDGQRVRLEVVALQEGGR